MTTIWKPDSDCDFANAFLTQCLAPVEQQKVTRMIAAPENLKKENLSKIAARNISSRSRLSIDTVECAVRHALVQIISCWTDGGLGGISTYNSFFLSIDSLIYVFAHPMIYPHFCSSHYMNSFGKYEWNAIPRHRILKSPPILLLPLWQPLPPLSPP